MRAIETAHGRAWQAWQAWVPGSRVWAPAEGEAAQLFILLHGWGAGPDDLVPLAQALARPFPQALVLAPPAPEPMEAQALAGRQWFSLQGVTDADRPQRVQAALPWLEGKVRQAQSLAGVAPQATALLGFSQGAIMALALALAHDGLVGRVLSFAGRLVGKPEAAPQATTLHFFHGEDDEVIPARHSREALGWLAQLQGDATADLASDTGHTISPELVDCALHRLTHHIPLRTWRAALAASAAADVGKG